MLSLSLDILLKVRNAVLSTRKGGWFMCVIPKGYKYLLSSSFLPGINPWGYRLQEKFQCKTTFIDDIRNYRYYNSHRRYVKARKTIKNTPFRQHTIFSNTEMLWGGFIFHFLYILNSLLRLLVAIWTFAVWFHAKSSTMNPTTDDENPSLNHFSIIKGQGWTYDFFKDKERLDFFFLGQVGHCPSPAPTCFRFWNR